MNSVPGPTAEPAALPSLRTAHAAGEILERLDKASRRGRLPGYRVRENGDAAGAFSVAAFSEPFDHELDGTITGEAGDGSRTITFRLRMLAKAPAIFLGSIVLSLWPGLPILDTMIPSSWGWWATWTWYVPLCLVPLPFLPRMLIKSRSLADESAREAIATIAKVLDVAPSQEPDAIPGSAVAARAT